MTGAPFEMLFQPVRAEVDTVMTPDGKKELLQFFSSNGMKVTLVLNPGDCAKLSAAAQGIEVATAVPVKR